LFSKLPAEKHVRARFGFKRWITDGKIEIPVAFLLFMIALKKMTTMKERPLNILLVEDDEDDYVAIKKLFSQIPKSRCNLEWVDGYETGMNAMCSGRHDVCLLDYRLGERTGLEFLSEAVGRGCKAPIIFLTGQGDYDVDVEAMKAGASDYLIKGQVTASVLERTIRYALEWKQTEAVLLNMRSELEKRVKERTIELLEVNAALTKEVEERRRAEQELRESEERFRLIAETSNDAIFQIDADGILTYSSRGLTHVLGYSPEEVVGTPFSTYFSPSQLPRASGYFKRALAGERLSLVEVDVLTKTGTQVPLEINISPVLQDGKVLRIQGVARDVTERKKAEEELRQYWEALEETVEARTAELKKTNVQLQWEMKEREKAEEELRRLSSQLLKAEEEERKRIAMELHDGLGQTLSAIKFRVEMALKQMGKGRPKEAAESLNLIVPVARGAVEEVRRISSNLRPAILDDLGILATLDWVCREFAKIYPAIRLHKKIDIEEKEVPNPLKIVFYRLLQEALNNVVKYSRAKSVSVSLKQDNGRIDLVIEDNGTGFDVSRVLSEKRANGGLGLAGMRERTDLSGGVFSLESAKGKGTTIRASWIQPKGAVT
jgi:PAS domain S-box-containing protein